MNSSLICRRDGIRKQKASSSLPRNVAAVDFRCLHKAVRGRVKFISQQFKPAGLVGPDDKLMTNGVTSLIDLMVIDACDLGKKS
ncbi:hypothetical protein LX32DRAFT_228263 [Colletotrichum zoysiae]|uniref:Uncharacterized protein n=1 Tax=Colletotrichum zoysiae TaxID=1216348 RepID=A0AAD9HNF6_9PEZI|nr:hypothetical protein LX32DRAFT_228263 [Colletotrichum zoysiae]